MCMQCLPALSYLYGHGAGHDISRGQVFGVRCIALHEALSFAVDQDPSLASATLRDQTPGSIDPWKDSQTALLSFLNVIDSFACIIHLGLRDQAGSWSPKLNTVHKEKYSKLINSSRNWSHNRNQNSLHGE